MSRKFTAKENIALLLCVALFLSIFYYQIVWKSTEKALETYDVVELENELLIMQSKALKLIEMQNALEEYEVETVGVVADYNNLENEIMELNQILSDATMLNLEFESPTTDGSIVRRNIFITFQTNDYQTAKRMIDSLKTCKYKLLIRDVNLSAVKGGLQSSKNVNVSLKVTFYEGVSEAAKNAGLQDINSND